MTVLQGLASIIASSHIRFFDGSAGIQVVNMLAMLCAMNGSKLYVKNAFEAGSKSFTLGNVLNIAVGLAIGNIPLIALQVALTYFSAGNYKDRSFNTLVTLLLLSLIGFFGISTEKHIHLPIPDLIGSALAIYGAFCMKKKDFRTMAIMWIVADIIFAYVAIREGLLGLFIQSIAFTYHGYLRLRSTKTINDEVVA